VDCLILDNIQLEENKKEVTTVGTKEHYKDNSFRVREIYGYERSDKTVNIHHIVLRSDYKRDRKFWDASVPTERFDLDAVANLCPLPIEVHANLHRRLEGLPPVTIKRRPEVETTKPKKRRKKKKKKSRSKRYRGRRR